ncbi:tRNA dihydrouridine synthase [Blautia sp. MSJ-19]|uniref:tRNA dihydrouridine synthase n=1 Tax=Blautia sp. MSJ-19 TaxID=2841517 RepID=UPI001C0EE634|nr:tRNA-dihydrouridine synthase family protein [Blautia sp. MSJ-19]MBU5481514.1 tRNA-dihydrouridine synthase family protein [Blautia sp. MSJ-19]
MRLYLAPLEGITNYIYRRALFQCFDGFDKYFIPFIRAKQNLNFSGREKKDISPENNAGMYTVPQILTRNAEDFLRTASQLQEYGYQEVNLNLGCPSKTVVTKGCGAGFLERPEELERFLDKIFSGTEMKISVKTRLGMEDAKGFSRLMKIYNRFPMEELIIHPRVQKDFYKNTPDLEMFGEALVCSQNPICYNGDIFSPDAFRRIKDRFPEVECFMMGRGVLADPSLALEIKGGKAAEKTDIRKFHDLLYHTYREEVSGDRNVLFKMKELWFYLAPMFEDSKKYAKKIKKSEKCAVYESAVNELFANCRYTGVQKQ